MLKSMEHRIVREVMTRRPKTVGPKTDVRTLKAMFEIYEFNAFPVVDGRQILLGVVTRLDFLRMFRPDEAHRWIPDLRTLWAERVEDIMSRGLVTVRPEDPVAMVVEEIVRSKLRSLPVVERRAGKDVLVGIVTRRDVLKCLTLTEDGSND
jgi:CBS-domain-containing membrane protein